MIGWHDKILKAVTMKKTIDYYKQLCRLVCDEGNFKIFSIYVCTTDKGCFELNYSKEENDFYFSLMSEKVETSEKFKEMILPILEQKFKNK